MLRMVASLLRMAEEFAVIESAARSLRLLFVYAALGFVAVLLALSAIGCAASALWIWALGPLGPVGAPLLVASVFGLACLIVLISMNIVTRRRSRSPVNVASTAGGMEPVRLASAAARGFMLGLLGHGVPNR